MSRIHLLLIGVCSLPLFTAGCAHLDLSDYHLPGSKPKPKAPARLVDIWSDTILNQSGKPGVRGFGGRITFYTDLDSKPVTVEGTLTVYAFDASDPDTVHAVPERKFVLSAEQLTKHMSKSKLGYSYSVWLPWDEVGNPERQLMLMTRFEAQTGEVVMSAPSRQTLPGTAPTGGATARVDIKKSRLGVKSNAPNTVATAGANAPGKPSTASEANPVKTVAYEDAAPAATTATTPIPTAEPTVCTFTIDVPQTFAQQALAGANTPVTASPTIAAPTAASTTAAPGRARGSATEISPSTSSAPSRFPARRAATVPLKRDPVRRQPHPAGWPSQLPPTPRSDPSAESTTTPSSAESKPN